MTWTPSLNVQPNGSLPLTEKGAPSCGVGAPEDPVLPWQLERMSPSMLLIQRKVSGSSSKSHEVLASKCTSPFEGKVVSSSGEVQFTKGAWFDNGRSQYTVVASSKGTSTLVLMPA